MMKRRALLLAGAAGVPLGAWGWQAKPAAKSRTVLEGRTLEGQRYELAQDTGKVVLVFFWSTECAICRDKLPELRRNFLGWRGKGFQIVAVSTDPNLQDVRTYVDLVDRVVPPEQRFPMLWRADPAHRDSFGAVGRTPQSFVLDRQGRVAHAVSGRIDNALWDEIAELVLV